MQHGARMPTRQVGACSAHDRSGWRHRWSLHRHRQLALGPAFVILRPTSVPAFLSRSCQCDERLPGWRQRVEATLCHACIFRSRSRSIDLDLVIIGSYACCCRVPPARGVCVLSRAPAAGSEMHGARRVTRKSTQHGARGPTRQVGACSDRSGWRRKWSRRCRSAPLCCALRMQRRVDVVSVARGAHVSCE